MTNSVQGGASDFNTKIIEEFRANEGRVGGPWAGTTMILIQHIGAKSGIERVSPLACSRRGAGRRSPCQPAAAVTATTRMARAASQAARR